MLKLEEEPTTQLIYSLNQAELAELRKYIDNNIKKEFIRESQLLAGALILFVLKKKNSDGNVENRLCIDYRRLNAIIVKNYYLLPLIEELKDRLIRATYFTKLDIRDTYYRIRIKVGDEWKIAFKI